MMFYTWVLRMIVFIGVMIVSTFCKQIDDHSQLSNMTVTICQSCALFWYSSFSLTIAAVNQKSIASIVECMTLPKSLIQTCSRCFFDLTTFGGTFWHSSKIALWHFLFIDLDDHEMTWMSQSGWSSAQSKACMQNSPLLFTFIIVLLQFPGFLPKMNCKNLNCCPVTLAPIHDKNCFCREVFEWKALFLGPFINSS